MEELSKSSAKKWRKKFDYIPKRQNNFIPHLAQFQPHNLLVYAFLWSNTEHGRVFWEHINTEWIKALEKTKNMLEK